MLVAAAVVVGRCFVVVFAVRAFFSAVAIVVIFVGVYMYLVRVNVIYKAAKALRLQNVARVRLYVCLSVFLCVRLRTFLIMLCELKVFLKHFLLLCRRWR